MAKTSKTEKTAKIAKPTKPVQSVKATKATKAAKALASPAAGLSPREQTRAWFREAKFGLFIHWGVYALLGKGEWIRTVDKIPQDEYAKLPPKFNPKRFDPDAWAELAQRAGMTKQAMAALVTQCEAWGMVQREDDPRDGRARRIVFTATGLAWLQAYQAAVEQAQAELVAADTEAGELIDPAVVRGFALAVAKPLELHEC